MKKIILNNKKLKLEAKVLEFLSNSKYKLKVLLNNKIINGYLCGRMIKNHIRLIIDDYVIIQISDKDVNWCRIIYRK